MSKLSHQTRLSLVRDPFKTLAKRCRNSAKTMTLGEPATGAHLPVSCPQLQFSFNDRLRLKRGNERKVFFERSNEGSPNPLANQPIEKSWII